MRSLAYLVCRHDLVARLDTLELEMLLDVAAAISFSLVENVSLVEN